MVITVVYLLVSMRCFKTEALDLINWVNFLKIKSTGW